MDAIFGVMNLTVLPFWLAMILAPGWRGTQRLMAGPWGVLAPALAYLVLVLPRLPEILPVVARPELPAVAALLGTPAGRDHRLGALPGLRPVRGPLDLPRRPASASCRTGCCRPSCC